MRLLLSVRIVAAFFCIAALPTPALSAGGHMHDPAPVAEGHTDHHGSRADEHAPIGVMGEHMHPAGGWMLSYRFMRMRMRGNRDGTQQLSSSEVLTDYLVTPLDMTMDMHMFGAMYAPTDWVTLMAMLPYVDMSMDHLTRMGGSFKTKSNALGDLRVGGMFRLLEGETHLAHLNFAVGFPTGSIDEEDLVPVPGVGFRQRRLPYPMQPGSGSFSLIPGLTYTGRTDAWSGWSWGAQALGTIYLNENWNDYRVGNKVDFTAWLAKPIGRVVSTALRFKLSRWYNYSGADPALAIFAPNGVRTVPTADPDLRGGLQLDLAPSVNVNLPLGPLGEHRLAVEFLLPVYRDLDGPQLERDWTVVVGWQKAF